MSDFFKRFLSEDPRRLNAGGRYVGLAAFGKHPGWDDHVEDLGLETESLNLAKTVFYVNGIGGQIDSGAWEKLEPAQLHPAFNHVFVWQRGGQFLIGRLWSSSDGKGRKRYPMVVCLHFAGVSLGWALPRALQVLAELEAGCVQATSAEEVRALLNRTRAALRETLPSAPARAEHAPVTPEALGKILQSSGGAGADGFPRVLYQMQGQLEAFAPGKFTDHANAAGLRAQQIRVPAAGENPEQTLLFWTRFFHTHVDASVPLLLTMPLDAGWVDVTAGEPESHEFFCLRASPKSVPLASEVPYTLDEAFRAKAGKFLRDFQHGETARPDLQTAPAPEPAGTATPAGKSGWLKWFALIVVVAAGAVAVVMLLPAGKAPSGAKAPESKPDLAQAGPPSVAAPSAGDAAKAEAARVKAKADADAETARAADAARVAEAKAKADAAVAAAKLRADAEAASREKERLAAEAAAKEKDRLAAEAAAAKEKERLAAEAAAKEKERQQAAAAAKELQDQQLAAQAAAKKKADDEAAMKLAAATPAPAVAPESRPAAPVTPVPAPPAVPASASSASPATTGGDFTNSIGMALVRVPSGIWVGRYEVTQAEYQKVMGSNPSKAVNDRQPVERVDWNEAKEFCRKLNEMERGRLPAGMAYNLPTEKQWKDFAGDQKFEDIPGRGLTTKGAPAPVGQAGPANKFGLYDVLGNVWEWCLDGATGDEKLLKGGAFNSANLDRTLLPDMKVSNCGFRCVLAPP